MLSTAQHKIISPVVAAAWRQHCHRRGLDPSVKKRNGYREWYETTLVKSVGVDTTSHINTPSQFGKALAAFAIIAGDEKLVRRLAEDEERRSRWVLRMLAVDLSFLKGEEVTWDYIRAVYGQSNLPPGELEDCPQIYLNRIIAMMDIHITRKCKSLGFSKYHLPRRAAQRMRKNPAAMNSEKVADTIERIAYQHAVTPADLIAWHDALLAAAERPPHAHQAPQTAPTTEAPF